MDIHYVINLLEFKEFETIEEIEREDEFICYKIIVNEDEYIEYAKHCKQYCRQIFDDGAFTDRIINYDCYHIARFLNNDPDRELDLVIDSSHEMYEKAITGEKMIKSYLEE